MKRLLLLAAVVSVVVCCMLGCDESSLAWVIQGVSFPVKLDHSKVDTSGPRGRIWATGDTSEAGIRHHRSERNVSMKVRHFLFRSGCFRGLIRLVDPHLSRQLWR